MAQLHALAQPPRSISSSPVMYEDQSDHLRSEGTDCFPPQAAPPLLQVSPVSPPPECRRLSDSSIRSSCDASSENLSLPVSTGRRHSDLSSLLSLGCHPLPHFAMHRSHSCQACLSLLLARSRESSHRVAACPYDCRHHPSSSGTLTPPIYCRPKASNDCSDFSLLQQSLFNIISRKAPPCHSQTSAAPHRPPPSGDGDGSLKTHPPSGSLLWDQEHARDWEDRFCTGEQHFARAVGGVGHHQQTKSL